MNWKLELFGIWNHQKNINFNDYIKATIMSFFHYKPFPIFDAKRYLKENEDLQTILCPDKIDIDLLVRHYYNYGFVEGRKAFVENSNKYYEIFPFQQYTKHNKNAYVLTINNDIWACLHYLEQNKTMYHLHIKPNNIFNDEVKDKRWINFLNQELCIFDTWNYQEKNQLFQYHNIEELFAHYLLNKILQNEHFINDKMYVAYCGKLDNELLLHMKSYCDLKNANKIVFHVYYNEQNYEFLKKHKNSSIEFTYLENNDDLIYDLVHYDIGIGSMTKSLYKKYSVPYFDSLNLLQHEKFVVKQNQLLINNRYVIDNHDNNHELFQNIIKCDLKQLNHTQIPNNITVKVKFQDSFQELFHNEDLSSHVHYDFQIYSLHTNENIELDLYENVFYKIETSHEVSVYLSKYDDNLNQNVFRDCLNNFNNIQDIYFVVSQSGKYKLNVRSNVKTAYNLYNYININYLCGENVYMLNLKSEQYMYSFQEMILNKHGIKVQRFNAINGKDSCYDALWEKYLNKPFTEFEERNGRQKRLTRGSLGYLLSMESIFEKNLGDYVCVFDDDFYVSKNFTLEVITKYLLNLSNFNILKLGSSQWKFENIDFKEDYYHSNYLSNGSFCNIYKKTTYHAILKQLREFNEPFDAAPLRLFNNNKSYVVNPNLVIAKLDKVSSISNLTRNKDYERFKWNLNSYHVLPDLVKDMFKKDSTQKLNTHFYIGIITFKRFSYLKECLTSLKETLLPIYNFTIVISHGLNIYDSFDYNIITLIKDLFMHMPNVSVILKSTYLHYMSYMSNNILNYSNSVDYDFGFLLNDDIIFKNDWYMQYYNTSKKYNITHLCYLTNNEDIVKKDGLKHKGSVLNANGVLLTFDKKLIEKVGYFNTSDFKVRGQSHIEWSIRCCNAGFNDKHCFYDISNSEDYILLNSHCYSSSLHNVRTLDKVIYFVDDCELKHRNTILNTLLQ